MFQGRKLLLPIRQCVQSCFVAPYSTDRNFTFSFMFHKYEGMKLRTTETIMALVSLLKNFNERNRFLRNCPSNFTLGKSRNLLVNYIHGFIKLYSIEGIFFANFIILLSLFPACNNYSK